MSDSLIVRDEKTMAIAFVPQAIVMREQALANSGIIGKVDSPETQENAVNAQRRIRWVLKQVEDSRKSCKEPFLEIGRQIDSIAKMYVEPLKEEELRVAKLLGDYQADLLDQQRAANELKRQEEDRIKAEQEEAIRKATEEAQKKLAEAKTPEETKDILDKIQAEAQRQAELAKQQYESIPTEPEIIKAKGQMVHGEWNFEVTDIWLLAKMHPALVRIEPNRMEIKECLKRGITKIAGLRVWQDTKSSVRLGPERKAIEI